MTVIKTPHVSMVDLSLSTKPLATGWNAAIARTPKVQTTKLAIGIKPPAAISLKAAWSRIKTFGFTFPEAPHWGLPQKQSAR